MFVKNPEAVEILFSLRGSWLSNPLRPRCVVRSEHNRATHRWQISNQIWKSPEGIQDTSFYYSTSHLWKLIQDRRGCKLSPMDLFINAHRHSTSINRCRLSTHHGSLSGVFCGFMISDELAVLLAISSRGRRRMWEVCEVNTDDLKQLELVWYDIGLFAFRLWMSVRFETFVRYELRCAWFIAMDNFSTHLLGRKIGVWGCDRGIIYIARRTVARTCCTKVHDGTGVAKWWNGDSVERVEIVWCLLLYLLTEVHWPHHRPSLGLLVPKQMPTHVRKAIFHDIDQESNSGDTPNGAESTNWQKSYRRECLWLLNKDWIVRLRLTDEGSHQTCLHSKFSIWHV